MLSLKGIYNHNILVNPFIVLFQFLDVLMQQCHFVKKYNARKPLLLEQRVYFTLSLSFTLEVCILGLRYAKYMHIPVLL